MGFGYMGKIHTLAYRRNIENGGDTYIAYICIHNFIHNTQFKKLILIYVLKTYVVKNSCTDYEE